MQEAATASGSTVAQSNPDKAIELIQAQIAGARKEIADLTGQLVPGQSDARENAIDDQLSSANERLQSLQNQLDRVVSGDNESETTPPLASDGNDIPRGVANLLESMLLAAVIIVLGFPFSRVIARRMEPRPRTDPASESSPRFERLEQAMDAVAIEVERVSEGQRFTNKLLGEMRALPAASPLEQWPLPQGRVAERVEKGTAG